MNAAPNDFTVLILRRGLLSAEQLLEAVEWHAREGIALRDAILKLGYATEDELMQALAEYLGVPFINLPEMNIPPSVIELIPESVARENLVLPLRQDDGVLTVIVSDPGDQDTLQKLRFILNKDIRIALAPREQIIEAINRHYGQTETESVTSMLQELTDTQIDFTRSDQELSLDLSDPPGADADSEFELTLDDSVREGAAEGDIFETEFDVPALEEESGSEAVALATTDTDLESADFDVAVSDDDLTAEAESGSQVVAVEDEEDDAAATVTAKGRVLMEAASRQPAAAPDRRRMARRQATVRYYHRMNPEKLFPLLVVLSENKIREIVQRGVSQKVSKSFKVEQGSFVEVEPILPGCTCYPPREQVRVGAGDKIARFYVVPHVLGALHQARVVVRQNGETLAEVPLEARVVKQTMTLLMAGVALLLPLVAVLLQHFRIDFRSQSEQDFSLYREVASVVLGSFSPDVLALTLLGMTAGLYLWLRPRKRDLFWDITPAAPEQQPAPPRRHEAEQGQPRRLLSELMQGNGETQAALLAEAARKYGQGDSWGALSIYETVLARGKAPASAYARAALAAGRLGKNARALSILKAAVEKLPASEVTGAMWYNLGCFAVRLGLLKDAVRYLGRAVDVGYANLHKFRTDPDLSALRGRPDFKTLVACIDS